ncbi:MAG: PqqD family protein [Elusimicrobia bacterium]|nr:PqqD family protein [Elusimicrobiota bacterium]
MTKKEKPTDLKKEFIRNTDILASPIQEELVMFDVEAGKYFSLNGMAAVIWRHLGTPVTVEALCTELQKNFDVSAERCKQEVAAFVSELEAKGLIRTLEPEK